MAQSENGLLSPFRVLDLTDEFGFLCGKILGDLGADVIKIERPGGDPARNIGPFLHDQVPQDLAAKKTELVGQIEDPERGEETIFTLSHLL